MLTAERSRGCLHRNQSDIVHFFHAGDAIEYLLIDPAGELYRRVLGPDPAAGQVLQLVCPRGWWKATRLSGGEYGLVGEAVAPGFEYRDRELASPRTIERWAHLRTILAPYVAGS
jgi:predicted cupin superfamily sugar epimerase